MVEVKNSRTKVKVSYFVKYARIPVLAESTFPYKDRIV